MQLTNVKPVSGDQTSRCSLQLYRIHNEKASPINFLFVLYTYLHMVRSLCIRVSVLVGCIAICPIIIHKIIHRKRTETLYIWGAHVCAGAFACQTFIQFMYCHVQYTCLLLSSDFRYWIHVFTAISCLFTFSVALCSCCCFICDFPYSVCFGGILCYGAGSFFFRFECRHRNTAIYIAENENAHIRIHCLVWACDSIFFSTSTAVTKTTFENAKYLTTDRGSHWMEKLSCIPGGWLAAAANYLTMCDVRALRYFDAISVSYFCWIANGECAVCTSELFVL